MLHFGTLVVSAQISTLFERGVRRCQRFRTMKDLRGSRSLGGTIEVVSQRQQGEQVRVCKGGVIDQYTEMGYRRRGSRRLNFPNSPVDEGCNFLTFQTRRKLRRNNQEPAFGNNQEPGYRNNQEPVYRNNQEPVFANNQECGTGTTKNPSTSLERLGNKPRKVRLQNPPKVLGHRQSIKKVRAR